MKKDKTSQKAQSVVTTENQPNETTLVISPKQQTENETVETTAEVIEDNREREPKSVKDILEKHGKIAKCIEKRASIDEASKTLDSFNLGTSRIKDTLTIEDGNGNVFETSKTDLIEDVINLLKQRVETKTAEVEAELLQLEAA